MQPNHWDQQTIIQPSPHEQLQHPIVPQETGGVLPPSPDRPKPTFENMYKAISQQKERADAAVQKTQQELAAAEELVRTASQEFESLPFAVSGSASAREKLLQAHTQQEKVAAKLKEKYWQLQSLQMEFQPYQAVADAMKIASEATERMQAIKTEAQKIQDEHALIQTEWKKVDGIEAMAGVREWLGQESHFLAQEKQLTEELAALKNNPERLAYAPFRHYGEQEQYAYLKVSLDASDEAIAVKESQIGMVQRSLKDTRAQLKQMDDLRLQLVARHNDCSNRYQTLSTQYIAEEQRLHFAQVQRDSNTAAVQDSINQRARSATLN